MSDSVSLSLPTCVKEFIPPTICWLPVVKTPKRKQRSLVDIGHFIFLRQTLVNHECIWNMIECGSCPILERKYHVVDPKQLLKNENDTNHYMGVAMWFVLWNEALGIEYLHLVHKKYEEYKNAVSVKHTSKSLDKWRTSVIEFITNVRYIYQVHSSPDLSDNCLKSSEFLLEPKILVQLPWKPVLFHQWLVGALAEILIFEKETLEFRHWPLTENVFQTAMDMLTLIRLLKERIILGLLILMTEVLLYPEIHHLCPERVTTDVVTPSLETLEFLISGNALKQLKYLKKHAWAKARKLENKEYFMPFSGFLIDKDLIAFYIRQCYNYDIWNANEVSNPFPDLFTPSDIIKITKKLNENKSELPKSEELLLIMKPFTCEEKNFFEYLEHNQKTQFLKLSPQERIDLTIKTINDLVLEPGRITGVTLEAVKQKFLAPEVKKHAREIFKKDIMKEATHLAIGYTMMYWQAYVTLLGSEKENSVIGRLTALGLEIIEKEQIIRLTNACSAMFRTCPVAIQLDSKPNLNIEWIKLKIQSIRTVVRKKTDMWKNMPLDWCLDVNISETLPDISLGEEEIIKIFSNRIGRIIFDVSMNAYSISVKDLIIFKPWQIVQYVMPCFVASYLKICERHIVKDQKNYLLFLHSLMCQYEKQHGEWATQPQKRKERIILIDEKMLRYRASEILYQSYYLDETLQLILFANLNAQPISDNNECLPGYNMLRDAILYWPKKFLHFEMEASSFLDMYPILEKWLSFSLDFFQTMLKACKDAFNVPEPGITKFKNEALAEMYLTDCVVLKMLVVYRTSQLIVNINTSKLQKLMANIEANIIHRNKKWKYTLYRLVFNPEMWSKTQINTFVNDNRKSLSDMYYNLKKYRQSIKIEQEINIELLNDSNELIKTQLHNYITNNFEDERCTKLFSLELESIHKPPKVLKKCKNCEKSESRRSKLRACEQCIKDKYPVVHYYCSPACQEEYWNKEHMAEHLEFDLGLSDFSHLNLNA